ncbi:MAG: hypothetical protein IJO46_08760, partial [Thermoguttaceae bacterium]|nr:hypothetical protein [Thermoguttaceae bacterium]
PTTKFTRKSSRWPTNADDRANSNASSKPRRAEPTGRSVANRKRNKTLIGRRRRAELTPLSQGAERPDGDRSRDYKDLFL